MNIVLYAAGYNDNGKAGCGIVLQGTDEYDRECFREFGFGLYNSCEELAHLQAVRLGLAAVRPAYRKQITIYVDNGYAYKVLLYDEETVNYQEVITELKKWLAYFNEVKIEIDSPSVLFLQRAAALAQTAANTQMMSDSKTVRKLQ